MWKNEWLTATNAELPVNIQCNKQIARTVYIQNSSVIKLQPHCINYIRAVRIQSENRYSGVFKDAEFNSDLDIYRKHGSKNQEVV